MLSTLRRSRERIPRPRQRIGVDRLRRPITQAGKEVTISVHRQSESALICDEETIVVSFTVT